jgi:menaquinone-dependent protoporphyrinogen IX oxidase
MRAAVIYFAGSKRQQLTELSRALAQGLEEQGHQVDIIDAERDVNTKLTIYNYLAIGAGATSFFGGKISDNIARFLANSGMVSGKRSFAFIVKGGLRTGKTLQKLMRVMEHEGMYLKYSEVLSQAEEAHVIGRKLHVE